MTERRFITIGTSNHQRLLFVAHGTKAMTGFVSLARVKPRAEKSMPTKKRADKFADDLRPEYDLNPPFKDRRW